MMHNNVFTVVKAAAALASFNNNRAWALDNLKADTEEAGYIKSLSLGDWNEYSRARSPAAREFGSYIWGQSVPGKLFALANDLPIGTSSYDLMCSKSIWIGEGVAAPLVDITSIKAGQLKPHKIGSLVVCSRDLWRECPELMPIFQNSVASEAVKALDKQFLSNSAGDAVTPAGIFNNVTATGQGGLDLALNVHGKNGNNINRTALVCGLGYVSNFTDGEREELRLLNIPIIISQYADVPALIDCSKLNMSFSGTLITESEAAAVEMIKKPTGNSVTPVAAKLVSMFQTNSVALNAITYCTWDMPADTNIAPITLINSK